MKNFKKTITIVLFALSALTYLPVSAQVMDVPPQTQQQLDISWIKEELETDTSEANQSILDKIFNNLNEIPEGEIINELAKGLTIDELKKLYNIFIESNDYRWTENFSEKVWNALSLKIKVESPVLYGNPRVKLIAVSPGERQFFMMLSDGSIWEVADHLSGDPSLDLIVIRSLLGQYTKVEELNLDDNYSHQISALGFPEIRFNGYMLANKTSSLVLEKKELFWFGELY